MSVEWATWTLSPRDPLVFGSGSRMSALEAVGSPWLPPQATAAGVVRSTLAGGGTQVTRESARDLLDVRIRGPWLVRGSGGGEPDAEELWVPIPADAVVGRADGGEHLVRGELIAARAREGVSGGPGNALPPLLMSLPSRWGGRKTGRSRLGLRPLLWVVGWSLGDEPSRPWSLGGDGVPLQREHRVHLGIQDERFTAEPEALFGTSGVRFADSFRLAIEVRSAAAEVPRSPRQLVVVGGEGRVSELTVRGGASLPPYERFRQEIESGIERLASRSPGRLGLRLQLLSAGSFGGWRPERWAEPLDSLHLQAVVVAGFEAISGWNLQGGRSGRGAPRRVRRLVPAGSVYFFGPITTPQRLAELCESLWGTSLCEGLPGDADRFLAPPAHDGYGTVLPLPCFLPSSTAES